MWLWVMWLSYGFEGRSSLDPAKEGAGEHPHHEHKPAQDAWRPYGVRASIQSVDHYAGDRLWCARQRRRVQTSRHPCVDEAGTNHEHTHSLLVQLVAESLREGVQAGLGRSVDRVRAPWSLGRHRGEHDDRSPLPIAQASSRVEQERSGAHEVDPHRLNRSRDVKR